MKNKHVFSSLTLRMTVRVIVVIFVVVALFFLGVALLVDWLFEDVAANVLASLGWYAFFRDNKTLILAVCFLAVLLLAVYLVIRRYSQYLIDISEAIDQVQDNNATPIVLQSDLAPFELQLNHLKNALRQREYEARESEQRKDDLVVYLAHDLKTPLTSVIGYLTLLTDGEELPPDLRKKYLGITLAKAERLEELINEFFEITRFSLQGIQLEMSQVNLTLMLEQLADEFYPLLAEKELTCLTNIAPGLTVRADSDKLARVFDNLLRNAVNYSRAGTAICLDAARTGDTITVSFRNVGDPIPSHKLDSIFEKFYRLDSARSQKTGGAGLGLAIAKQLVELHGGTIRAESNPAYTQFTVTLKAPVQV